MYLFVGLGNPGEKYRKTRHNIGFRLIDHLVKSLEDTGHSVSSFTKFNNEVHQFFYKDLHLHFIKPLLYMNLSGNPISLYRNFYKINLEKVFIIYDDVDLSLGTVRIRKKGSAGGHNGMKSIIQSLGTENFSRIRIGIKSEKKNRMQLHSFVLNTFNKEEEETLDKIFIRIKEIFDQILENPLDLVMSRFNGKTL